MAYRDPSLIRDHVVKIRLNDREHELLEAWANYTGEEKAALVRNMVLEQARLDLDAMHAESEGPQFSLLRA